MQGSPVNPHNRLDHRQEGACLHFTHRGAAAVVGHHRRPRGVRQAKALEAGLGGLRRHGSSPATLMGSDRETGVRLGLGGYGGRPACAARSK
ncbi:MAG: hypothetical protein LC647_14205 [Beggiatoa sp.]|nr:hypothetical protein [Beggiatoa sp.]